MTEGSDYSPGAWEGHDFKAARAHYDQHAGRSYAEASAKNVSAADLVPPKIATESTHPLLVWCDVSGSMNGWPNTIFSKLPYLDHEIRTEYLGEDAEVCYGAISDTSDSYPFQVQPFAKGTGMTDALKKLVVTNGGSGPGSYCEAYGVAALYAVRNINLPKSVIKPPFIIIGDEMPYDIIRGAEADNYARVHLAKAQMTADEIFAELIERYSVYFIQKPYNEGELGEDRMTGVTKQVFTRWERILGAERIAPLPEAGRVVDVIFGILAREAGRIGYFRDEIEGRQNASQVKTVYTALRTVHAHEVGQGEAIASLSKHSSAHGKSTLHRPTGGKKSGDLL